MPEQGGAGATASAAGVIDSGLFFWEPHSWAFSNSENSGSDALLDSKKPIDSSSNSPTIISALPVTAAENPSAVVTVKHCRQEKKKSPSEKNQCRSAEEDPPSKGAESDHEIHIWTERERRKKMRNMFSNLHSLLPQLPTKADKSTIVDEAVNYIKTLEQTLMDLEKKKLEMVRAPPASIYNETAVVTATAALGCDTREGFMADQVSAKNWDLLNSPSAISIPRFPHCFQTWSSPNVVLSICGEDAQISICTTKKTGLLASIAYILEKHRLEVVTSHISSDYFRSMIMIHTRANWVPDQFSEVISIEDIYKLAVGEMIYWLSS